MPKQSRAEVGIAQTKCCVELSEGGRKRHPDQTSKEIIYAAGPAGREPMCLACLGALAHELAP